MKDGLKIELRAVSVNGPRYVFSITEYGKTVLVGTGVQQGDLCSARGG